MNEKTFGMRREDDIKEAVNKEFQNVKNLVKLSPPKIVGFKLMIYWTRNKGSEFISMDDPAFVLQEILKGGSLSKKLEEYGKKALIGSKPKGIPAGAKPLAAVVSTEATYATRVLPHDEKSRRVRGMPVLIISGRTENGMRYTSLTPLAEDQDNEDRRLIEPLVEVSKGVFKKLPPPPALVKKLQDLTVDMDDFMIPFFEGYKNGGTPAESFMGIT